MWAYNGSEIWSGGMGMGMIGMSLFWVLIIVIAIVVAGKIARGDAPDRGQTKTAMDILKERYARGEIDRDEFETKRRDVEG